MKYSKKYLIFIFLFYLLIFQNPIADTFSLFGYIDEIIGLLGLILLLYVGFFKKNNILKSFFWPLMCFIFIGLLGDIIYHYQPINLVAIDFLTNIKFFAGIVFAFFMMRSFNYEKYRAKFLFHIKLVISILFILVLIDYAFHIFPQGDIRYGLRCEKLFFGHCTYLAGAGMFLLAFLMLLDDGKSLIFKIMISVVVASTFRGKALAGVMVFFLVDLFINRKHKKLKIWQIALIVVAVIYIGYDQFSMYYSKLYEASARSILTLTSLTIMKDYFPIGTGFATYASHVAGEYYSPVYLKYGLSSYYELREGYGFFDDTFWPIIFGQTGVLGTIFYVLTHYKIVRLILKSRTINTHLYKTGLFCYAYLLISSTSEPAFNNSIALPLGVLIGIIIFIVDLNRRNISNKITT